MIEIFEGNWNEKDVIDNPDKIFIFGDNNLRYGKGGQAIIRDLVNTYGIRTKRAPNNDESSFYTDDDYDDNILRIRQDIRAIKRLEDNGKTIVFSSGGYGTGLAKLNIKAPNTFRYLNELLMENFNYSNTC